jgi:hypothetical protein
MLYEITVLLILSSKILVLFTSSELPSSGFNSNCKMSSSIILWLFSTLMELLWLSGKIKDKPKWFRVWSPA